MRSFCLWICSCGIELLYLPGTCGGVGGTFGRLFPKERL